ncbi:hypothetical protein O181_018209 [Austropuccinia psidii MF-1]|uniref:Phosphoserine phosphatase n=1 Tax=Austropuccinia psidii MF-1 TaxID=1389203 RepID=A0A9Q3GTJ4_9BASI|nr:hypothetical protein [Austropuccinia psidii MF-1]
MSNSQLPHKDAKFIVFSDFDGTITTEDSNDHMTDNLGFGYKRRRELNIDILEERVGFKQAFQEMLDSVSSKHSFDECREIVKRNIKLDEGFKDIFNWAKSANVPVVIVSSGMTPIIRAIFENLVGKEDADLIEIIANDLDTSKGSGPGQWTIKFRHPESAFGHDKDRCISPYRFLSPKPTIFFCGDGVSDLSAAKSSDCLFVKIKEGSGNDLAKHCERESIPHVKFGSFLQVKDIVQSVVEGNKKVQDVLKA